MRASAPRVAEIRALPAPIVTAAVVVPTVSGQCTDLAERARTLARCKQRDSLTALASVTQASVKRIANFGPADLSKLACAVGKGGLQDPEILLALAGRTVSVQGHLTARQLTDIAWSFARLCTRDAALASTIAKEALARLNGFGSRDLSSLLWAQSRLTVVGPKFFIVMGLSARRRIEELKPQDLSSIAWALATALVCDTELSCALAGEAASKAQEFNAQDFSNFVWAIAKPLITRARPPLQALSFAAPSRLGDFLPQNLSNAMWALATLIFRDTDLIPAAMEEALGSAGYFGPQEMTNLLWSFATFRMRGAEVFHVAARQATSRLTEYRPQELSNLVWAFAASHVDNGVLFNSVARAATSQARRFALQGLSNLMWAFATLAADDTALFQTIARVAMVNLPGFKSQEMSNLLWAFVSLSACEPEFLCVFANEIPGRLKDGTMQNVSNLAWALATSLVSAENAAVRFALGEIAEEISMRLRCLDAEGDLCHGLQDRRSSLVAVVMAVMGTIWSLSFAGHTGVSHAMSVARPTVRRIGRALDGRSAVDCVSCSVSGVMPQAAPEEPRIVLDLPALMAIDKPPDWEVYLDALSDTALATCKRGRLSEYVQGLPSAHIYAISRDMSHQYGFLHRLDVPGSGLVLTAKTYEAYYDLQLQLNAGEVVRDYVVLCHGWVPPERSEVAARVHWDRGSSAPSRVLPRGKPARTRIKTLAHAVRGNKAFSLVVMRIGTGRRHQIRVHAVHIGHPTVCDGKYTAAATFSSDRVWCPRNFLHRYRLAFRDLTGQAHEVFSPLPAELAAALSQLSARDGGSAEALRPWLEGGVLQDWDAYEVLQACSTSGADA